MTKKEKYRFHEIDSFCCWMCKSFEISAKANKQFKMKCKFLKSKTEPSFLCDGFSR